MPTCSAKVSDTYGCSEPSEKNVIPVPRSWRRKIIRNHKDIIMTLVSMSPNWSFAMRIGLAENVRATGVSPVRALVLRPLYASRIL